MSVCMNRFIYAPFFELFTQETDESLSSFERLYDNFVRQLIEVSNASKSDMEVLFALNYTQMEFFDICFFKKNKGEILITSCRYAYKALKMVESMMDIIYLKIAYPESIRADIESEAKSPIYLSKDIDYIDVMEVICGLFYSNSLCTINGERINFSDLVAVFEKGFNFKFTDKYKKRDDVFCRKQSKLTEFLSELILAIKLESKNRGYL